MRAPQKTFALSAIFVLHRGCIFCLGVEQASSLHFFNPAVERHPGVPNAGPKTKVFSSPRRKPGPRLSQRKTFWIPAVAGMTKENVSGLLGNDEGYLGLVGK
jgi:hypothetical protein